MFLFICTAILVAIFLGAKLTKDIFPRPLKVWLLTKAISNWMKGRPQTFGTVVGQLKGKKSINDLGVIPTDEDAQIEKPVPVFKSPLREECTIYGTDETGHGIFVKITNLPNNQTQADVLVWLKNDVYHVSFQGQTPCAHEFSLGNLKLEMAEPYRTWRLWYNGIMTRESTKTSEKKIVHGTFNFIWKALSSPMDHRKNGNPNLLADNFSSKGLFGENLPSLLHILPEGYSQMGTLHGNVSVFDPCEKTNEEIKEDSWELYLRGFKRRELTSTLDAARTFDIFPQQNRKTKPILSPKRTEFFGLGESGDGFRLCGFNDDWTDGRMLWASYENTLVKNVDCSPFDVFHQKSSRVIHISGTNSSANVEIHPTTKTIAFSNGTLLKLLDVRINGETAKGFLIQCSNIEDAKEDALNEIQKPINSKSELSHMLDFSDPACLKVSLVGGKGASLAKLQNLTDKLSNSEVKTAKGFCVTTNLFRESLKLSEFTDIFDGAASKNGIKLEDACSSVMKNIKSCNRLPEITSLISQQMAKTFGSGRSSMKFAVRSSGVLEDGSDLSCAGQNETFLGVTESSIAQRVLDCWASLFTEQSVRYRLNHGQPAVSEMAVVVQEMVDASAAGVIFTADPRTGNPFEMVVTANYGLGESVVSGSCDPDTITLARKAQPKFVVTSKNVRADHIIVPTLNSKWWKDVTIEKKVLGDKKSKIEIAKEGSDDSTKEHIISEEDSKQFCIKDETAIELGKTAAEIEFLMGQQKPVDIEWAIDSKSGKIFVLQCRNLTALDAWTDFELMHEFDSPIRTNVDRFTTANTGEVLPKALSSLTVSVNRIIDLITQEMVALRKGDTWPVCPYNSSACPLFQQRLFLNMYQTFYATVEKEITAADVCVDQTIFGRQVMDEEIRSTAEKRFGIAPGILKFKDLYDQIQSFRKIKGIVDNADKTYKRFKLDYSNLPQKASNVYEKLTEDLFQLYQSCTAHLAASTNSSASQIFLFMFLADGKKPNEWDSSLYEDASKLLSVFSDVESAELPNDINRLLDEIIKHGGDEKQLMEEFVQASPSKALEWLRDNAKTSQALDTFFELHGHRGICEMDLGEPSWGSNPTSFLPILKSTLKNRLSNKDAKKSENSRHIINDDELLSSLSTNLKPMSRRIIKFILPTCRNAVIYREKTKSLFVRVCNEFKLKYQDLAELMVRENLLPNSGLIKHLNHFEIGQLIKKDQSSSVILQKALKRNKMYPLLEKLQYPEISIGMPKELDNSIPVTITDTIQATPVSRGTAKGVAKVCLTVEEASEILEPGDILITVGTDIAWSPFFSILGGVVTELGGLISHGAVVAREYGLPCIVGAVNATKIFKSGDHVILDAGKGTLSKTAE